MKGISSCILWWFTCITLFFSQFLVAVGYQQYKICSFFLITASPEVLDQYIVSTIGFFLLLDFQDEYDLLPLPTKFEHLNILPIQLGYCPPGFTIFFYGYVFLWVSLCSAFVKVTNDFWWSMSNSCRNSCCFRLPTSFSVSCGTE